MPSMTGHANDGAIGIGYHTEVKLAPSEMGWVGWADAIRIDERSCEILDYKTGEPKPDHADQLRIYALLWSLDTRRNPGARRATRLAALYPGTTVDFPAPSDSDLIELRSALAHRVDGATAILALHPPKANVSPDNCHFCEAKHLCTEYWRLGSQAAIGATQQDGPRSLEVVVSANRSNRAWAVRVEFDPVLARGTEAVAYATGTFDLAVGSRVRLMNVRIETDPETDGTTIGIGPSSEVFLVPTLDDR